jgi:hypothetical protein
VEEGAPGGGLKGVGTEAGVRSIKQHRSGMLNAPACILGLFLAVFSWLLQSSAGCIGASLALCIINTWYVSMYASAQSPILLCTAEESVGGSAKVA